ncbi:hypothetical protein [Paenibacillus sp. S-12]|uniref:hypothetical protein n=1 Tax=Paenibacillus sp. S-12 TaxID=3031371 RepID=UPI0025A1649F|nr:hypothetical protein [Paenibacillus sp. S-12]
MIKNFKQTKESLLKKIDSVVFYLDTFSSSYKEILESQMESLISLSNEIVPKCETVAFKINANTEFVQFIIDKGEDINEYEEMIVEDSNNTITSFSHLEYKIRNSINEVKSFMEPQEALPIYQIQSASTFVYIFSIYESFLKGDSDESIFNTINSYKNNRLDETKWGIWANKAHKFRILRNDIVHLDVSIKVTRRDINELIRNIEEFIDLYGFVEDETVK